MSSSSPLPPGELADHLAEVYLLVGPLYRKVLRIVERDQVRMGMSVGVRAVLDELRRSGPQTVPQIARTQRLSRQFIQRMVDEAKASSWVEIRENPAHRRSSLVAITPAGKEAIVAVIKREHELMSQVGGDLTGPELQATKRVLGHMLKALDALEETQQE